MPHLYDRLAFFPAPICSVEKRGHLGYLVSDAMVCDFELNMGGRFQKTWPRPRRYSTANRLCMNSGHYPIRWIAVLYPTSAIDLGHHRVLHVLFSTAWGVPRGMIAESSNSKQILCRILTAPLDNGGQISVGVASLCLPVFRLNSVLSTTFLSLVSCEEKTPAPLHYL